MKMKSKKPRFFVAISLPDDAKDRLVALKLPDLHGIRPLGRQELHLTLHFLGEVGPHVEAIQKALATVTPSGFAITIQDVGKFPPQGEPTVLWAGVLNSPALVALHHSIAVALTVAFGFQPEVRPYSPHITLARLKTPVPPGVVERFLDDNKGFVVSPVILDRFALYSSVSVNDVPQYRAEAEFRLSEPQLG